MANSWDNRVKFIVRYLYDIDNNGYLDKNDFACLALRATLLEGKGEFSKQKMEENEKIMMNHWHEIADLADFNKDGQVTVEEFKGAVKNVCMGKKYSEFPQAMKMFIDSKFKEVDVNGDGIIGPEEFRFDCINRAAYSDVEVLNSAYENLCNEEDKKKGGINLQRYQDLYAEFLANTDESTPAANLFGPLVEQ